LVESQDSWGYYVRAVTACTVLALPQQVFEEILGQSEALQAHVEQFWAQAQRPQNSHGEANIELTSGHEGSRS